MKAARFDRLGAVGALAALFLSLLNAAPSAKEPAANAAAQVRVFPDHYIAAGKRFAGLDDLDGCVRSSGARSLQFHACMWTANERLTAAIERFQHVYVDVRWTAPGKSGCPAVAGEKAASARWAGRPAAAASAAMCAVAVRRRSAGRTPWRTVGRPEQRL